MFTLADYTRLLRPEIPRNIIADADFKRILDLTEHFSSTLANEIFCLEIRLLKNSTYADFILHLEAKSRAQLLSYSSSAHLSRQLSAHPIWQKIHRFALAWNDPAHPVYNGTDHVWLEYDLDRPVSAVPVPDLFWCQHNLAEPSSTILALADIFYGPVATAPLVENLTRCLQHMPQGALLNQIGFGLQRSCDAIRIHILGMAPQDIPHYLETIGWRFATAPLQPLLSPISRYNKWALAFDVATSIKPKVSFEYMHAFDHRLQEILDDLVDQGLCDPVKRDFLTSFTGVFLQHLNYQVSVTSKLMGHIKLSYHPEQPLAPLEAKAYLFFLPSWYSAQVKEDVALLQK